MRERRQTETAYEPPAPPPAPSSADPLQVRLCGTGVILYEDPQTSYLAVVPTRCNRWDCQTCGPYRAVALAHKATAGRPERFLTLTLRAGGSLNLDARIKLIRKSWVRLVARIRRVYGPFEWFAALELTQNGTPHLHILTRGSYISHRWLSAAWCALTGSYIVHIVKVNSFAGAAQELTKYITKTAGTLQHQAPGRPVVTMSRGWLPEDFDQDPNRQPPDTYAAHFAVNFQEAAVLIDALGGSLQPVADKPRCWFVHWPSLPDPQLCQHLPTELSDPLKSLCRYLLWRAQPNWKERYDLQAELVDTWGVYMSHFKDRCRDARDFWADTKEFTYAPSVAAARRNALAKAA